MGQDSSHEIAPVHFISISFTYFLYHSIHFIRHWARDEREEKKIMHTLYFKYTTHFYNLPNHSTCRGYHFSNLPHSQQKAAAKITITPERRRERTLDCSLVFVRARSSNKIAMHFVFVQFKWYTGPKGIGRLFQTI